MTRRTLLDLEILRDIRGSSFLAWTFRSEKYHCSPFFKNIKSKICSRTGFRYEFSYFLFSFESGNKNYDGMEGASSHHWETIVHPRNVSRCEQYVHYEKFVERYLNLTVIEDTPIVI